MARTKIKTFTKEELEKKKAEFEEKMTSLIEDVSEKRTPTVKFLDTIKETLEKGVDSKVSYSMLSKTIMDVYSVSVSPQVISTYVKKYITNKDVTANTPSSSEDNGYGES